MARKIPSTVIKGFQLHPELYRRWTILLHQATRSKTLGNRSVARELMDEVKQIEKEAAASWRETFGRKRRRIS